MKEIKKEKDRAFLLEINEWFSELHELCYLEMAAELPGFPPSVRGHVGAPPPPCGCQETGTDGQHVPPAAGKCAELWGRRPALQSDLHPAPANLTCDKQ